MKFLKWISQALCNHIPIESYRFTRKNGGHVQHKIKYDCFKCGKRMKS